MEGVGGGASGRRALGLRLFVGPSRRRLWKCVTALISGFGCMIYKANLAPWRARAGDTGVRRVRGATWA